MLLIMFKVLSTETQMIDYVEFCITPKANVQIMTVVFLFQVMFYCFWPSTAMDLQVWPLNTLLVSLLSKEKLTLIFCVRCATTGLLRAFPICILPCKVLHIHKSDDKLSDYKLAHQQYEIIPLKHLAVVYFNSTITSTFKF